MGAVSGLHSGKRSYVFRNRQFLTIGVPFAAQSSDSGLVQKDQPDTKAFGQLAIRLNTTTMEKLKDASRPDVNCRRTTVWI